MAQRRMFSPEIVCSDAFLDMSSSSRDLYFQLGMKADDDGFVSPRGVMRYTGSSEDDLKLLIAKRFVLPFENGVIVIKHWRINNFVRKDRYRQTTYLAQRNQLFVKPNQSYSLNDSEGALPIDEVLWKMDGLLSGQPLVDHRLTQVRLGKVSKDSALGSAPIREEKDEPQTRDKSIGKYPHAKEVFSWFPKREPSWAINTTQLKHAELLFMRGEKQVKAAFSFLEENKDHDYCPQVLTPSDLERKWPSIFAFKRKYNL